MTQTSIDIRCEPKVVRKLEQCDPNLTQEWIQPPAGNDEETSTSRINSEPSLKNPRSRARCG